MLIFAYFFRYFSRLLVMKINLTGHKKYTGDARRLEDAAREASSALPLILSTLNKVSPAEVHKEVENLQSLLKLDIRIMEGIALPVLLARKVLNTAQRYDLMPSVLGYLREVLVPYYKEVLTLPTKDNRTDDVVTVGGPVFSAFLEVCNSQREDQLAAIVSNSIVAVRADQIKQKRFREEVVKFGGRTNHSVRLNGKPRKCLTLPKKAMTSEQWETVTAALLQIGVAAPDLEADADTQQSTETCKAPPALPTAQTDEDMEVTSLANITPAGSPTRPRQADIVSMETMPSPQQSSAGTVLYCKIPNISIRGF
uniref:Uncharacterized protein LOC111125893 n=1 Tax=Crassostrea virginica TaxID=6565 RepID=A0A8B8DDR0_CRAVI|nr:uncharacterized protein LOC111125893 [Crassostrea virginica]